MPSALDVDLDGDAGDWRLVFVARLAEDNPPHKKGDILRQVSAVETAPSTTLSFATPSSVAMSLNVAAKAAASAQQLQLRIVHEELIGPSGKAFGVTADTLPVLFDFLEQCMVSAVFAYQAIEAFANHVISRQMQAPMEVETKGKKVVLQPDELEKRLTTSEKLSQVLPVVRGVSSPKGTALWQRFRELEDARDSTIHLKVRDQFAKDKDALFFKMLGASPSRFPLVGRDVVRHYFHPGTEPRWLLRFEP